MSKTEKLNTIFGDPKTLYGKAFKFHVARVLGENKYLQGIPKHAGHEVTSPPFFDGLRLRNISFYSVKSFLGVIDHNIATTKGGFFDLKNEKSKRQIFKFMQNSMEFGIKTFHESDKRNGIIHMVPIEQCFVYPGDIMIGCDSHITTTGAQGSLSMGVGSSEGAHQVATGSLPLNKLKTMQINIEGYLKDWVTSKDVIMYIIGKYGTDGAAEYAVEFSGSAVRNMSIEQRLTICNMGIEMGAQVAMIGVDEKTIDYIKQNPNSPKGEEWDALETHMRKFVSEPDAEFDKVLEIDATDIDFMTTYGTNPGHAVSFNSKVPSIKGQENALLYTQLESGQNMSDINFDFVFLGSCTNGRIEDLRLAAKVVKLLKLKKHKNVKRVLIVPGSMWVKKQAENEDLDKIFIEAGFEWREPGCSSCLGMNPDTFPSGTRIISTSNRNFVGRQGKGAITHLSSVVTAMIGAIHGKYVHPEDLLGKDYDNSFENIPAITQIEKLDYFIDLYEQKEVSDEYKITNEIFKSPIRLKIAMTRKENIDTDEIAPSDFLKVTTQEEIDFLGNHLFDESRFEDDGVPGTLACNRIEDKYFFLNIHKYRDAKVLVSGKNYGCGSSREHAVWAMTSYGFKVVISESFSNIYTGNSLYNKLLLIKPTAGEMSKLFDIIESTEEESYIEIDLINQIAKIADLEISFEVDTLAKEAILTGKEIVDITLKKYMSDIDTFHVWLEKYKTWES